MGHLPHGPDLFSPSLDDPHLPHRAQEVKESPFFHSLDWQMVFLQKYPPPLIPPRGEVNAADAFDIGSFDEEDTKGIKVLGLASPT